MVKKKYMYMKDYIIQMNDFLIYCMTLYRDGNQRFPMSYYKD